MCSPSSSRSITAVSFIQVIARYGFNTGWGGALEFTRILFAWMILFGMSYGVSIGSHLGVDAVIRLFPKPLFKAAAIFGALCGVVYGVILLSADWLQILGAQTNGGAIDYWSKIYKIGIGLDDLRYPEWMQAAFGLQERVHRWIAYLMLPIGLGALRLPLRRGRRADLPPASVNSWSPDTRRKNSSLKTRAS